jgi:hypothetical protein
MGRLPTELILRRIAEDGDDRGVGVLADDAAHLPKKRDFAASVEMIRKLFQSDTDKNLRGNEALMLHARRLTAMSHRLMKDRENLKPVLEGVRETLEEWDAWIEVSEPTEEEFRERLETFAQAITSLREAMADYDAFVMGILTEAGERRR